MLPKKFPLLLAVLAVTLTCTGGDTLKEVEKRANTLIHEGKHFLATGRYTEAKLKFIEVLEEVDGGNSQARFGKVLASMLEFVSIVRVVNQLTGGMQADENEFLHDLIDDLISDLIRRFDEMAFDLLRVKGVPNFRFVIEEDAPVDLDGDGKGDLNLQGEWDRGEVFLLDVPVQLLLGVLNLFQAIDIRADYLGIYNKFTELDISLDFGGDVVEGIEKALPKIQILLAFILNNNPNFLELDPETGKAQMSKAGIHLGNALDSLRSALFFASKRIEVDRNQGDDIVGFKGRGPTESPSQWVLEPINRDLDFCAIREDEEKAKQYTYHYEIRLIRDKEGKPFTLDSSPATACLVGKLMENLLPEDDPRVTNKNVRINLLKDVVPLLLTLVESLAGVSPDLAKPVVESVLGNAFEFDFRPFFHKAVGPRNFLPAWDTPAFEGNENLRTLWLERECRQDTTLDAVSAVNYPQWSTKVTAQPYRVIDRFTCSEDTAKGRVLLPCSISGSKKVCDIDHFPAYSTTVTLGSANLDDLKNKLWNEFRISPIQADGIESDFPYVAFRDPTFNNLLYLDLYALATAGSPTFDVTRLDPSPGFSLATQETLNAAIAILSKRIGEILDLVGGL